MPEIIYLEIYIYINWLNIIIEIPTDPLPKK